MERQAQHRVEDPAQARPAAEPVVSRELNAGSILALQRSAGNAAVIRALQRSVKTSGGEWDTDRYAATKDIDNSGSAAPAADGWRGVDITLKFHPNDTVNAELIGLTQTAQTIAGGTPQILPAAASRAIPAADAKPLNTGPGETDESAHIDQSSSNPNPLYAVENPNERLVDGSRHGVLRPARLPFQGQDRGAQAGRRQTQRRAEVAAQPEGLAADLRRRPRSRPRARRPGPTTARFAGAGARTRRARTRSCRWRR